MSEMTRCPKCATRYLPATSSSECPHRWIGRATPLLDELAAKMRRGEPVKFESWKLDGEDRTNAEASG